jgi:fatty acid desaturase
LAVWGDWAIIFSAAALSQRYPHFISLYIAAVFLIASRQHALLVLMHEGAHGHLLPSRRWNDLAGNAFTAWPFGLSMEKYRDHHWKHHQHTNTEKDPDWGRKVEHPHWRFPKSERGFWRDFLPYLWGLGLMELWFARKVIGVSLRASPVSILFYAAVLGAVAASGAWLAVWKYWLVPYFVLLPILMKVRSIVEHLGLPNTSELTASRNIVGSPLEAFFFGPHGNSLHLVHHLYPQIPWFNVGKAQAVLKKQPGYREGAHESIGYFLPNGRSAYGELVCGKGREKEEHDTEKLAA